MTDDNQEKPPAGKAATPARKRKPAAKKRPAGKAATPLKADSSEWRKRFRDPSKIKFNDELKKVFIKAVKQTGRLGAAAEACQISNQTYYYYRERDENFAAAVEAAIEHYRTAVAAEVHRRAVVGYEEPIYSGGKRVLDFVLDEDNKPIYAPVKDKNGDMILDAEGNPMIEPVMVPATIKKFSDRLLELEAKRADPTYRDKQPGVNIGIGADGNTAVAGGSPNKITIEFVKPGEPEPISMDNVIEGTARLIEDDSDS